MKLVLFGIFYCSLGFSDLALAAEPSILKPQRYISLPAVLATSGMFSPDFSRVNYGIKDQKFFTYISKNLADGSEVQLKIPFGENDDINNRGSAYLLGNRTFSPDSKTLGWSYIYKTGSERYSLFFEFYDAVTLKKLRTLSFDKDRPVSSSQSGEIFFTPDSRKALLLGQMSSTIEIVDMRDGNVLKLDAADKMWADNIRVTFSTDSSKLVLARDGHVEMFDLSNGKKLWGYYNPGTPTTYSTKVEYFNFENLILLTFSDFESPLQQAHLVLDAKDGREVEFVGTSGSEFGNGGFEKDQRSYLFIDDTNSNGEGAFITNIYDLSSSPAAPLRRQIFGENIKQCQFTKYPSNCNIDVFSPVFSARTNSLIANVMKYPIHFPAVFDLDTGAARFLLDVQGKEYIESVNSRWNVFTLSKDGSQLALKVQTSAEKGFFIYQLP